MKTKISKKKSINKYSLFILLAVWLSIPLLHPGNAHAATWLWDKQPYGNYSNLYGVTWGNGFFLAVGHNGEILTSSDGLTWSKAATATSLLENVSWNGSLFAAAGWGGLVITSPDGSTWTVRVAGGKAFNFKGITWGPASFVAVGTYGNIWTGSQDGKTWTLRQTGSEWLEDVTYGASTYVAVGQSGAILTSPTGTNWTNNLSPPTTSHLYDVAYGNSTFVAVGPSIIVTSQDGFSWSVVPSSKYPTGTVSMNGVYWDGNKFLIVGSSNKVLTSLDGQTWGETILDPYTIPKAGLWDMVRHGDRLLAVGNSAFIVYLDRFNLSVTLTGNGQGKVTSSPAGIDCGANCSATYDNGTVVTLTASPDPKFTFKGWSGACSGDSLTCDITIDQAQNVSASFGNPFSWIQFLPAITKQ